MGSGVRHLTDLLPELSTTRDFFFGSFSTSTSSISRKKSTKSASSAKKGDGGTGADVVATGDNVGEWTLFERSTDNYLLLRTGVGFSSFHSLYWLWYVTDFIPAVNASPVSELHIDPTLGWAGLGFALSIQAVFLLYPKRLVSRLALRQRPWPPPADADGERRVGINNNTSNNHREFELVILTHTLPLIRPSTRPSTVVPVGGVLLDPNSSELQTVLGECSGDLSEFRGVLGMGRGWPPYLLDVRESSNVPRPGALLSALLYPPQLVSALENDNQRLREGSGTMTPTMATERRSRKQRQQHLRGGSIYGLAPQTDAKSVTGEKSSKLRRIVNHRR
jgi:hypothetical protein